MVITVAHVLEAPTTSVLELLGHVPPGEVVGSPTEGRHAISSVRLEQVETRCEAESASN